MRVYGAGRSIAEPIIEASLHTKTNNSEKEVNVLKFLATLILINLCFSSFASEIQLKSNFLKEMPEVLVKLPSSYATEKEQKYPVFFILGGSDNVELVSSMLNRLYVSNGSNEHIIVGINSVNRLRDLAPTVNKDPRGPVGAGGGADLFLDFIEMELIPLIENKYRVKNHRVIAGHSVGGLLVIHTFHSRPELFQAHLAFSPAVWWGERETATAAQNYILSGNAIGSFLYMNIGSENRDMREVYDSFTKILTRNRSIDLFLKTDEFNEAGHDFTFAAGLYSALRGLNKYQQIKGI